MYSKLSRRRCAQELDEGFLFEPTFGPKYPRTKHQEFVKYFKKGVKIAHITAKVEFQKRVNIIPGQCILYFLCTSTVIIAYVESQGEN